MKRTINLMCLVGAGTVALLCFQNFTLARNDQITSLALASVPSTAQTAAEDFRGIYLFISAPRILESNPQFLKLKNAINNAQNNGIDGITIMDSWSALEPHPGQFEFEKIDRWIDMAVANHLNISIGVGAGFDTPAWLINGFNGNDPLVPSFNLKYIFHPEGDSAHLDCTKSARVPIFWDTNFKNRYVMMMKALHDHIAGYTSASAPEGAAYHALKMVKVGLISTSSYETRVGSTPPTNPCPLIDPSAQWISNGYLPVKAMSAWTRVATDIGAIFGEPGVEKIISVDMISDYKAFPNINNDGNPIPIVGSLDPVSRNILATGSSTYGSRFSVQWDALGLSKNLGIFDELNAVSQTANIGYQLNNMAPDNHTACGFHLPCSPSEYDLVLKNGIAHNARYLEIHLGNTESAFHNSTTEASAALKANP